MKGKQVTDSYSRVFHGLYRPVSRLGKNFALRKEFFEIPKLNKFKRKAKKGE